MLNFYSIIIQDSSCSQNKNFDETFRYRGNAEKNANNAVISGIYYVSSNSEYTNYPYEDGNGMLLVFAYQTDCIIQIYVRFNGEAHLRISWWESWQSWKKITS